MNGLLKFITCGSVDDGKSTLIGHILYDSKLLYADQEKALELDSRVGSRSGGIDYSLLLDGLMAEREQGITIDVAYRYFTTDRRSFIVADTPGHEEYTRNMAVDASFADLAVILVDASQGVLPQTRRHARICSLMGIRYFVFAVNKMDLIGYDKDKFDAISAQIAELSDAVGLESVKVIPLSATEGDNVTVRSDNIPWYDGEPLLSYLETVDVSAENEEKGFYMPVQRVCRPDHTFRGFQGQIEAGEITAGDVITILPSGEKAGVKQILAGNKDVISAFKGQSVTITLDREVDVSRGCVIANGADIAAHKRLETSLLWMDDEPLAEGRDFIVKLGTRSVTGVVTEIKYAIDVNSGEHIKSENVGKNGLAVCEIVLSDAAAVSRFDEHKTLGELILIDRVSNMTSACGVVREVRRAESTDGKITFEAGDRRISADIFDEFYYDFSTRSVLKHRPRGHNYAVGDTIPLRGASYQYPKDIDILVLRENAAVIVRGGRIERITGLEGYVYEGVPVINGRGFEVRISSDKELKAFLGEYREKGESDAFFTKWMLFETYRKVVIHNGTYFSDKNSNQPEGVYII